VSDAPLCLVLVNLTDPSVSPLASQLTAGFLGRAAQAFQIQLQQHIAPWWPYATGATARVASSPTDVGAGETPMFLRVSLSEPDAIADHYTLTPSGQPAEELGVDTCQTPEDVTSANSHENAEVAGDPETDQMVVVPPGIALPKGLSAGMRIARETCDPLQDRVYPLDLKDGLPPIMLADFVSQAYFDPSLSGPTSWGEAQGLFPRLAPFDRTPGGYQIADNGPGSSESQLFGVIPWWKLERARLGKGRWPKLGIKVHASGRHLGHGAMVVR
jgi:hypothetical protein